MKKIILLSIFFTFALINANKAQVSICSVTVDSLSTHNIIYWENNGLSGIDSIRIYRADTITGAFAHIASVSTDSLAEYHDYGAHPNLHASKYKISTIDTLGVESALSDYHKTIFMDTPGFGVLQWTLYEIENQANPVTNYFCYRDNTGGFNFAGIGSPQPPTNTSWLDTNYGLYPNADYVMDVTWGISCDPTRTLINSTRSNIRHQTALGIGISSNDLNNNIALYPNPATNKLIIQSSAFKIQNFTIYNVLGESIYQSSIENNQSTIDLTSFPKGIYSISINTESGKAFKKLAVQ